MDKPVLVLLANRDKRSHRITQIARIKIEDRFGEGENEFREQSFELCARSKLLPTYL
jgi:hypothetical protein